MQTTVQLSNEDIKNLIANAFHVDTEKVSIQVHKVTTGWGPTEEDMWIAQATVIIDNPMIMPVPIQLGVLSQTDNPISFRITNSEN